MAGTKGTSLRRDLSDFQGTMAQSKVPLLLVLMFGLQLNQAAFMFRDPSTHQPKDYARFLCVEVS